MQEQVEFNFSSSEKKGKEPKESIRVAMQKYLEQNGLVIKSGLTMRVGTDKLRGERDSAFYKQFPDDRHFCLYKNLTNTTDGAMLMIPYADDWEKEGSPYVYYAKNGIGTNGVAKGVLKIKLGDEEFVNLWKQLSS